MKILATSDTHGNLDIGTTAQKCLDASRLKLDADRDSKLDKLCHCESSGEIKMTAAIINIGELTEDELFQWAKYVAYHAAFWDHAIPRFYAFLNYAAEEPTVKRKVMKTSFLRKCGKQIVDVKLSKHAVPGDYLHNYYWTFMYHTFLAWRLQKDKLLEIKPKQPNNEQKGSAQ